MKKQSTPPYIKHATHDIEICTTPKQNGYYYKCTQCAVWVGWLSKLEVQQYQKQIN